MAEVYGDIKYIGNKLVSITGTENADVIELKCKTTLCQLRLNAEKFVIKSSQVTAYGLQVNGLGGDDVIALEFDGSQILCGINVESGDGDNRIEVKFPHPYVQGSLTLGDGANHVVVPEEGANVILFGANNNELSKITVNSCAKAPFQIELFENRKNVFKAMYDGVVLLSVAHELSDAELIKYQGDTLDDALQMVGSLASRLPKDFFVRDCLEE